MKKILITGGGGKIGTYFVLNHSNDFEITVVDIHTKHLNFPGNVHIINSDLSDYTNCQKVTKEMDIVIHLAAIIDETENDEALDINNLLIKNVFKATVENKCERLIFASSAQTIEHYPKDLQIGIQRPVRPHNLYGVSKCFGEALASYYAYQHGISAICLRIGAYEFEEDHTEMNARDLSAYLHPDDCNQLLVKCIETNGLHYEIFNAISNNRYKRLDISDAIKKMNYHPKADAFELFELKSP